MLQKLEKVLKDTDLNPISWLLGISGILMVRFFLEALSSPSLSGIIASDASTLLHYYLFWIFLALGGMIFARFAVPRWRELAPQIVLFLFVLIYIAPIVDFISSGGMGIRMSYLYNEPKELLYSFATFFGPLANGITIGIRLEILTILALAGMIIQRVQKDLVRTIVSVVILYTLIFVSLSLPSLISLGNSLGPNSFGRFFGDIILNSATFQNNLHGTLLYAYPARALEIGFNFFMGKIWYLVAVVLAIAWFFLSQKEKTAAVFKNSRGERVVAHLIVVSIGLGLSIIISPADAFSWNDFLSIVSLFLSFYFSWMFAICINDLADEKIDEISNKERPLIKGALSRDKLKIASYLFLTVSLIGAFLAGYYAFFCVLAFTSLYYIYSAPPTRFKRIPFFSSFLIALCCLSELIAGFFLLSYSKELSVLPVRAIVGIVALVFLWSHIRDLKDVEGDRAAGISTVPVIFGRYGFIAVAVMASPAYLLVPVFTQTNTLFIPAIPAAFATYYFITKKPYREWPIFATCFTFVAIGVVFVLISTKYLF